MRRISAISILTILWTGFAVAADIDLSSYDPPPKTLNGFVQIDAGKKVSNQFTLFGAVEYTVDRVTLLFDPNTPLTYFDLLSVGIYDEVINGGTPQPSGASGQPRLNFPNHTTPSLTTVKNKDFLSVTYTDGTSFKLPATISGTNYWLVVGNNNTSGNVGWAKTSDDNPIFNSAGTGSINPDTLNYINGIGWQKPSGGDGNQIMLFALQAPEPSTYVLGTIVAGVLAFTARHPRFRKIHDRHRNGAEGETADESAELVQTA